MLFEPGPIRLFTEEEIPALGPRELLADGAGVEAAALEATAITLTGAELALASAAAPPPPDLELAAAAAEHERQSRDADLSIAGVAAGAGLLEGELAGLASNTDPELDQAARPRVLQADFYDTPVTLEQVRIWHELTYGVAPPDFFLEKVLRDDKLRIQILLDLYARGLIPDPALRVALPRH